MSRPDRDGTKIRIGRDTGQDPRPEIFSGRDSGQGCPDPLPSREHPYLHAHNEALLLNPALPPHFFFEKTSG